jgi:hypothetical protein
MDYEDLLKKAEKAGLQLYENNRISGLKGLYVDNTITINSDIETEAEKKCILAEELGHYCTSYGNILDQSKVENRKQEKEARAWAYRQAVGLSDLVQAYKSGVRNRYELSEFLNVTEDFLQDALDYYKGKYGVYIEIDNYIIYFAPFGVLEKNF